MSHEQMHPIPLPTIRRFPSYLRLLHEYRARGDTWVSATELANDLQLKAIQVRKDIAFTGIEGKPKVGFEISELIHVIRHYLGWDNTSDAVLIGAGNLGNALAGYKGFDQYGLRIAAIFDIKKDKVGKRVSGITVLPMERLEETIRRISINVAIITVPADSAQAVAQRLVDAGIKGIWNFAPKDLILPDHVILQRTDLASSLAELSSRIKHQFEQDA